jgi:hypothetical protein
MFGHLKLIENRKRNEFKAKRLVQGKQASPKGKSNDADDDDCI